MDQLFNSTISLKQNLQSFYNATKTNSDVILGCFSHLQKLKEIVTQASELKPETQDIIGLISTNLENSKKSIDVLEKCFTYLTSDHNHVAIVFNDMERNLNKQLEHLRTVNKDIHYYLCDEDMTLAELRLEKAKDLRDSYYESNFKNSSPDAIDSSDLKEYEVIFMNYKKANSTLHSILDQCEDFSANKLAANTLSNTTASEDTSKQEQPISEVTQTVTLQDQEVANEVISETTSETIQSEALPETITTIEEVTSNITSEDNTILPETEVLLNQSMTEEVIYSEATDQNLDIINQTIESANITEVVVESL